MATPDGDVYLEDFSDEDHAEVHRAGPRGGAPPQLRKKMLYRFDLHDVAMTPNRALRFRTRLRKAAR